MERIACLFPGQGSQYSGMGRLLMDKSSESRLIFEEANDILGFDIIKMCLEGETKQLTNTANAQPAILTFSYASYKYYTTQFELSPSVLAGHSLGEYTALIASNSIHFNEALKIVRKRGELMENVGKKTQGSMAVIEELEIERIEEVCKKVSKDNDLVIANYNSPKQVVISGALKPLALASLLLEKSGGKVIPINVSAPFHSPLLNEMKLEFGEELKKITFNMPTMPVISNVDGLPYKTPEEISQKLTEQIVAPVQWTKTMNYIANMEIDVVIDFGPKQVVKKLALDNNTNFNAYSLDLANDVKSIGESFTKKYSNIIQKAMALAVIDKNNCEDIDEFNLKAIVPYNTIKSKYYSNLEGYVFPTKTDAMDAIKMLEEVLKCKQLDNMTLNARLNELQPD